MIAQMIVPYLSVQDGQAALAFYQQVWGIEPVIRLDLPDGRLMHCEFNLEGARIFLSEELLEHGGTPTPKRLGGTTVALHIYVKDCDELVGRMVAGGSEILSEPADMFWGDRFARVRDPFGHEWGISTQIQSMTPAEIHSAAQALLGQSSDHS